MYCENFIDSQLNIDLFVSIFEYSREFFFLANITFLDMEIKKLSFTILRGGSGGGESSFLSKEPFPYNFKQFYIKI